MTKFRELTAVPSNQIVSLASIVGCVEGDQWIGITASLMIEVCGNRA